MKVAVIGAGIVGIATACELASQQHEVTVFERRGSVATEGSFAQTGLLAACAPLPWGVPGLQRSRLMHWLGREGSVRGSSLSVLSHAPWLWRQWLGERPAARTPRMQALLALAHASRQRVGELTQQLNLAYEQQGGGMVLLSSTQQVARVQRALAAEQALAPGMALLSADAARALEPALAARWPLKGAVQLPASMVGNGRQLAHLLKAQAQKLGARFEFDTQVRSMRSGTPAGLVRADGSSATFDAIVVCAGTGSRDLLASAGLKLPLLQTQTHAVTAPLSRHEGEAAHGPRAAVIDARSGIVVTRLGQRVRASGVTQLGPATAAIAPAVLRQLYGAIEASFPGCAVTREASHWQGPRMRVPDGAPVIGNSGQPGLWLNLAHGAFGWGLAFGAAQLLARQLAGQPLPFDAAAFAAQRLR